MAARPEQKASGRILIVDDHEDSLDVLNARLSAWGYDTESARDGVEALALVETRPPDLVLLDIMMPRMNGLEVTRRIRANSELPFIPIILQTALESPDRMIEGLEAGADEYVTKPIDFAELRARLTSMLRIKRLQDAVTERERLLLEANKRLREISQTDALTGLSNRRHIEERLTEMLATARRLKQPFAVVLCDLDRFKSVNDAYGHHAGDALLREYGGILSGAVREIDRVGRYGGEEFMILLAGSNSEDAHILADRVRKELEAHTFPCENGTLRRSASFGVASWPHTRLGDADALVRAADDALYVAKETGRNRVVCFDSEEFNSHATHTPSNYGAFNFGVPVGAEIQRTS